MDTDKIAFIYVNGHPNTVLLADYIGIERKVKITNFFSGSFKNTIKSLKTIFRLPKNCDVYFVEGNFILPIIARKLHIIKKDTIIIKYVGEPIFYRLLNGETKGFKKWLLKIFLKEVDGFVCHGDWQRELLKKVLPSAKSMTVYTPILPKVFEEIGKSKKLPNLNSYNLLTIGNGRVRYKGLDISIEAFNLIKRKYKNAKLVIIGKQKSETIEKYKNIEGIKFEGTVPSLLPYIKDSSLYIHPSRGEAFGLSIAEAMLGGLPAIVSNDTGAKTLVKELGNNFISKTDSLDLYEKIDWYFNQSQKTKNMLSKKAKSIAMMLDPNLILPKFKKDFDIFVKELIKDHRNIQSKR